MTLLTRLRLFAPVVLLALPFPALAQYMFLDTNGDAAHDTADRLNANGSPTCVDVYLNTNHDRDGSLATCDTEDGTLDFNNYFLILRAVNGTVSYTDFINQQSAFPNHIGTFNADGIRFGEGYYSSAVILGPGFYKIASLTITGLTGTPRIDIVATDLGIPHWTSFGTSCSGIDFDNTYKLNLDWQDWDGLSVAGTSTAPSGINGRVTGTCPVPGTPLLGVDVCARIVGTTSPVYVATTNGNGEYSLSVAPGDYDVWVVEPLGFSLEPIITEPVFCNEATVVDFELQCAPSAGARQKFSWWRYQFDTALGYIGGNSVGDCLNPGGRAAYCADTLCAYLDRIYEHFYGNTLNQIDVYGLAPNASTCDQKLHYVSDLLLSTGSSETRQHKANRELMVLLLNVVSGRLRWSDIVSADGRTASQAITYFDQVIASPPAGDCGCYSWGNGIPDGGYGCAEHFAQQINSGTTICSGVIPASTLNIAYRRGSTAVEFRATPQPGSRAWTFSFLMTEPGSARLSLFDVAGRHIVTVEDRALPAGSHALVWNGRAADGAPLARGVYFAQLRTDQGGQTVKLPVTRR